jgi:bacillithiol biosynthesis deacetylase BshB1
VSPHPDDVELGIGGTIIKLKQLGHKVFIVDLTSGEPTPYGTEGKRKKETMQANKILKVDKRVNLGLKNRYLFDNKEARLLLAEQIRLFKPDILFCPSFEDVHPDHIAATKIAEAARFYAKYTKLSLKGKPHYPYHLFYYFCAHLRAISRITFLIDISKQFREKMKAMKCYRSQFIDNPNNRFVFDYIETQNRFLGRLIHSPYAEAVYCKEAIKVDDISCLL